MNVLINNEVKEISTACSLFELLNGVELSEKNGIAVAVNNTVITKSNWKNHELKNNDKIIIIQATQGG